MLEDQSSFLSNLIMHLSSFLSPKEAEAKVTPTDERSSYWLQNIQRDQGTDIDTQMRRDILSYSQSLPRNVDLSIAKHLNQQQTGEYFDRPFDRNNSPSIEYKDSPENQFVPRTISHELLHFILDTIRRQPEVYNKDQLGQTMSTPPLAEDHPLINFLLGKDYSPPLTRNTTKPLYSGVYENILRHIFTTPGLVENILGKMRE